jgi:hypothetical protein
MRKFLLLIATLVLTSPASFGATLTVKFINQSGQALNSVTAVPKGGDQAINLTAAPMADLAKTATSAQVAAPAMPAVLVPPIKPLTAAQSVSLAATIVRPAITAPVIPTPTAVQRTIADPSAVTFNAPDKACVFTLAFTFASGKITTLPDTDLCQTEQIVVE